MRPDGFALVRREPRIVVDDVEQRRIDLADIVEQRDPLDVSQLALAQICGICEDERVTRDAPDMRTRVSVVGIDRAEQRLEHGSGETLGNQASVALAHEQDSTCRSHREAEIAKHVGGAGKKRATR
jgi:hypothetical protein